MTIGTSQQVEHLDIIAPETTPYVLPVNDISIKHVKQVKKLSLIIRMKT